MSHSMKLNVTRVHRSIPTYRRNLWIHRASVRRKPTSTLSRRFRFQAVKASTSSETVQVQTKTLAKLTPFSEKEATDPSGQPGTALHDPPLCGRPDYFGAHFCPSIVHFCILCSNEILSRRVSISQSIVQMLQTSGSSFLRKRNWNKESNSPRSNWIPSIIERATFGTSLFPKFEIETCSTVRSYPKTKPRLSFRLSNGRNASRT